jgi:hypothetical protein
MIFKEAQPGFENVENLVQYACKKGEIFIILCYFGQQ